MNAARDAAAVDLALTLERQRSVADPLADDTIAAVLGPWSDEPAAVDERLRRIGVLNRLIGSWKTNADLNGWQAEGADVDPGMAGPLQAFVARAGHLPDWADATQIERAERLFFEQGPLSCLLLFCSSLPECYVAPDLAAVLHASGQLTQRTDYRVRSTAAMVFPVMMEGGLTRPSGGGIAQVLKVRLIHATIRHLILGGNPGDVRGQVDGLGAPEAARSMHAVLLAQSWDVERQGLPCNQEELAYTLLTFSHCFLRSLRRLHLGLPDADEAAYRHTWNVVGHVLGIGPELRAGTGDEAEHLFAAMQARGRATPVQPDPRPALASALMNAMSAQLPWRVVKPMPVLMTRHLCGPRTSRDLALDTHVSWLSRGLFGAGMALVRGVDALARLRWRNFSLTRFGVRLVGHQVITRLLVDQTRPLQLPDHLLNQVQGVVGQWSSDPKAPRWLNVMEHRFVAPRSDSAAVGL